MSTAREAEAAVTAQNQQIIEQWSMALRQIAFTPQHDAEIAASLTKLWRQLGQYLCADFLHVTAVQRIGAELCVLFGPHPEIFSETQRVLTEALFAGWVETACTEQSESGIVSCEQTQENSDIIPPSRMMKESGDADRHGASEQATQATESVNDAAQLARRYRRWIAVMTAMGLGFHRQLRSLVLAEQEEIRRSQLQAKQRTQLALQESRQRFDQLMSATFDAVLLHDGGFILDTNERFTALLGYPAEFLLGMSFFDLILPQDRPLLSDSNEGQSNLVTFYCQDGSQFRAEVTSRRCRYEGAIVDLVALRPVANEQQRESAVHDTHSPQPSSAPAPIPAPTPALPTQAQLDLGNHLQIDLERRHVTYDSAAIPLSKLEFDLLAYLAQQNHRICTYDELLMAVWDYEEDGNPRLVQLTLGRLRKKLASAGASVVADAVSTVRGIGLRLAWD